MKAADVYKRLKAHFGPWASQEGFSRLRRGVSWSRPHDNEALIFRFGVARKDYWDQYAGSQFVLDFEIGTPENLDLKNRCFRYWQLLTSDQLEELQAIQNRIISSLAAPPEDYELFQETDPETRAWYLAKFKPLLTINPRHDTWLRYYTPQDIDEWSQYLMRYMPHFLNEISKRT